MKTKYLKRVLYLLVFLSIAGLIVSLVVDFASIVEDILSLKINEHARFNSLVSKAIMFIVLLTFSFFFASFLKGTRFYARLSDVFRVVPLKISQVLNLRLLLLISIVYLAVLFIIGIKNYDLGIDEVGTLIYARSFYETGYAHCKLGSFVLVDNFAMLPLYLSSLVLFLLKATSVWHFKLLATILSSISLVLIVYVLRKVYDTGLAILFLFFTIIQPGFGFVAISVFGEITQACFIFLALYFWLHKAQEVNLKTVIITSLLFTIAIQTKFQLVQPLFLTLILYHFVDKEKKSVKIMLFSLFFLIIIAVIRFIPAFLYDETYLGKMVNFWYLILVDQVDLHLPLLVQRMQLFNKFFPLLLAALTFSLFHNQIKTSFEKFMYLFTLIFTCWWIFIFRHSTYRHFFMVIIPLVFLLSLGVRNLYEVYSDRLQQVSKFLKPLAILSFLMLFLWGCSANIIYAIIGYNDGVQFDLDGTKSRLYERIAHDNTQKDFYSQIKSTLKETDTFYVFSAGQSIFMTEFYLDKYSVFDKNMLFRSLEETGTPKLVIIDRTSFPLGLQPGYRMLDSLNLNRELILKRGEHELFKVYR